MHIIIGMLPHIIVIGMPMAIIELMASQRSFMRDIIAGSVGIIFIIMPSFVISQDIVQVIGIMLPIIMGIIMPFMPMPFIMGIMPFMPMPPIMGIMGIMPFMPPIIMGIMPFIGIEPPFIELPIIGIIGLPIPLIPDIIGPFIMGPAFMAFMVASSIGIRMLVRGPGAASPTTQASSHLDVMASDRSAVEVVSSA
jgi:hypothetical protein